LPNLFYVCAIQNNFRRLFLNELFLKIKHTPMKSILKYLLYAVLGFLFIGCFLPGSLFIEKQIEIAAPASKIYPQIADGKQWKNWSPWHALDPQAAYQYSEPSAGLGSWYTWKGDKTGTGKSTVVDTLTNQKLRLKLEFGGSTPSFSDFSFKENAGKTQVRWTLEDDLGWNPLGRWFSFVYLKRMLSQQYDEGLKNLKTVCEKS
jgi:Polyketide cyclase / dehydrase and lipid transport